MEQELKAEYSMAKKKTKEASQELEKTREELTVEKDAYDRLFGEK